MAREGRGFEILIKKLEATFLSQNAIINSPDFITDKITGEKREVDISIRIESGSFTFLAVIECRDRKAVEDITWIEQLYSKTRDLNVSKVIAVSSSGFSANAIIKARHYGIELRTYDEIDLEHIQDWFAVEHVDLNIQDYIVLDIEIDLGDVPISELETFNQTITSDKFITEIQTNRLVSAKEIFHASIDENVWSSVPVDNNFHTRQVNIGLTNPANRYKVENEGKAYLIEQITYIVDLKIDPKKIPVSRVASYKSNEEIIAQVVEFDGAFLDKSQVLQLIKSKDGSLVFSSRKKADR